MRSNGSRQKTHFLRSMGCLLVMAGNVVHAAGQDLFSLPLAELMQIRVDTASIQPLSLREQPGLVTVLNADDLKAAGVRTLQEALLLVPGVSAGVDVFNVSGLVFRGSWAYEGKILFLIDDLPVNDLLFGIYALPPGFPIELLDRIEVLRGPGAAKYGDNAQLAVVRLYTRQPVDRNGDFASLTLADNSSGHPVHQVSAGTHRTFAHGRMKILGAIAAGNDRKGAWTDATGRDVDLSQDLRSMQVSFDGSWHETRLQGYVERFRQEGVQRYGISIPDQRMYFQQANLLLQHAFTLSPSLVLTPRWSWRQESTWEGVSHTPATRYELPAERHRLELEARYFPTEDVVVRGGVQAEQVRAEARQLFVPDAFGNLGPENYFNGEQEVSYNGHAVYAEAELPVSRYQLATGVRYSWHEAAGGSFSPRLAVTRTEPDWHIKGLLGSAFREPQIEPLNQSTRPDKSLAPERTDVQELEAGHRMGAQSYLSGSLFRYAIRDSIVFSTDSSGIPGYVNSPTLHARGVEVVWVTRGNGWRLDANYSQSLVNDNAIAAYDVSGHRGQTLGSPRQVGNAWMAWRLGNSDWSLHPRVRYVGSRTATDFDPDLAGGSTLPLRQQRLDAEWTAALGARYQRPQWSAEIGISNAGDTEQLLPQPYNGISPPLPADARTVWLRFQYQRQNDTSP